MAGDYTSGSIIRLFWRMLLILNCRRLLDSAIMSLLTFCLSPRTWIATKDALKQPITKLSTSRSQPLLPNSTFTSTECPWLNSNKVVCADTLTTSQFTSDTHLPRYSTTQKSTCIQLSMPELCATTISKVPNPKPLATSESCIGLKRIFCTKEGRLKFPTEIFQKQKSYR